MAKSQKSPARSPAKNPGQSPVQSPGVREEVDEPETFFDPKETLRVRIQRVDDYSKRWVMHGYLEPGEATEGKVAELFGGGKYRASQLVADETGRHIIKTTTEFLIPGPYKPPSSLLPGVNKPDTTASSTPIVGTVPSGGVSPNETLNAALVGQVLDLLKMSKELGKPATPTRNFDWTPIISSVLALITTVATKLLERPKESPELARLFAQIERLEGELRQAKQQPGPAQNAIGDAVNAIKELLEVRDMISGAEKSGDPDSAMWALGTKLLEKIDTSPKAPALPGGGTTPQSPTNEPVPMWKRLIAQYRGILLTAAARGVEPEFAAETALRFMDGNVYGVALEFAQSADALTKLYSVIPELQQFPQFTESFLKAFRDGLNEDDGEGGEGEDE